MYYETLAGCLDYVIIGRCQTHMVDLELTHTHVHIDIRTLCHVALENALDARICMCNYVCCLGKFD